MPIAVLTLYLFSNSDPCYLFYSLNFQTSCSIDTHFDNNPRFSITSIESIKARHREDAMVVDNMEYVISDHEKNTNQYEKYKQRGYQI